MFSSAFIFLSLAAAAFAAPQAAPVTATAPTITTFGLNGSGCPPGSATSSVTDNGTSLTATFSQFSPIVTDANPTYGRQNCQATIKVTAPAGQQFSLSKVAYNGFVQLDSKVVVTHESLYYFQAQTQQNTASATLKGPIVDEVDFSNSFGSSTPIWSACGGESIINVNIAVAVDNVDNRAEGVAAVDGAKIGPFVTRSC